MINYITYRKALIVEQKAGGRNEEGTPLGIRWSATYFKDEKTARECYGDRFIRLAEPEDENDLEIGLNSLEIKQ